ncbi:hypothetical protein HMPREF0281_00145 [Corynebacterium ammoniagenes DSM 20306]|uniref:Uncharacterized protein n=1 Tax=Corynebacterium ammoniagenes DSM 20306 TaxID=649754 RepID=A0ABP2IGE2_CORAM|nr:hypothetical protein HMPREF0281_00145 [Corynebacterium ammoniagenes DSM 20306]
MLTSRGEDNSSTRSLNRVLIGIASQPGCGKTAQIIVQNRN